MNYESLYETLVSLREHNQRWKAHAEIHRILEESVGKSDHLREMRDSAQNEWRQALTDSYTRFVDSKVYEKAEADINRRLDAMWDNVDRLNNRMSNLDGRLWATAAILMVVIALVEAVSRFIPGK